MSENKRLSPKIICVLVLATGARILAVILRDILPRAAQATSRARRYTYTRSRPGHNGTTFSIYLTAQATFSIYFTVHATINYNCRPHHAAAMHIFTSIHM